MNVLQALNGSLHACMAESEQVYFLGEDILEPYGGAFKVARGLSTTYPDRVITTPVSEAGIVGIGIGMALRGLKVVVEIMFGDFIALAADQIINHAAKLRWMSEDKALIPLVIRTPMGGGRGYGPTHSQTLEKHFLGVPGLRVLAVSSIDDPGRLLKSAILEDDDPILFIEHKLLYAKTIQSINQTSEFNLRKSGERYPAYHLKVAGSPPSTLTITAYGYMAELALQAVQRLAFEHEIFADLVVPTQLSPFNLNILLESLAHTGRLLTIEEGSHTHGWGAEVVAHAVEAHGPGLHAKRLAARDMPIPASGPLEKSVIPDVEDIIEAAKGITGQK
jgi:pyruvate/2-oxoglutarate/acetoin dehydrogenase E1 component